MNQNYIVYCVLVVLVIVIGIFSTQVEKSYPDFIHNLSEEPLYKFIALCIIVFITQHNFSVGLLLSIIFLFTISDIGLLSNISESFTGPPVNSCQIYDPKETQQIGTAFYPLNLNQTVDNMYRDNNQNPNC
jgi:hypothetical protein